jgi:hypothetical protein
MIKEALQYLVGLGHAGMHDLGGRDYSDKQLFGLQTPMAVPLTVETLNALCVVAEIGIDDFASASAFVQVNSFSKVTMSASKANPWGVRRDYVSAQILNPIPFGFNKFLDPESFCIALRTMFVDDESARKLLDFVSNLTSERVTKAEDDGVSQMATRRVGVARKDTIPVQARWKLRPFRTFREVEQPASEFLIRLQNEDPDSPPSVALFEADGGKWKIDAVKTVSAWLESHLPEPLKKSVVF